MAFYLSPGGADTNAGTKARPLATLEGARAAVRRVRREGELPKGGVTVWLRGGTYVRTETFELTAEDGGTPERPVTYRAVPGETVRLIGGRVLSQFDPVTDPAVLARLGETARTHVVQCDLRALGLTNLGGLTSRGFGRALTPSHPEVFFNGRPLTLARWPNEGAWETIAGVPAASAGGDEHGGTLGALSAGFHYTGDRPAGWRDVRDLWVHGFWAWDWANSYEHVTALEAAQRWVRTAEPYGLYGFRRGQRFYFLNVLEELDVPGEWYLDRAAGVLYLWPPTRPGVAEGVGVRPGDEVLLSVLDGPLLRLSEVSHVTWRGCSLEATRGSGIEMRGGASNRIAACWLRNLGNAGAIVEGGQGHGVVGCEIVDTGDGGVNLSGGDRPRLVAGGHYVENCRFARQGRWSRCYVPAVLMGGVGMRASHNLISDHPHCAILFTGNEHLIEFNEIHHVALETGDVGAIYTGRDYTYRGNRIRHNFIHDIGGVGMGSMGAYMDDCVSGTEIYGNVFHRVQRAAFLGGGRDHRVVNNVFVDCHHAVELDGRGLDPSPVWRNMVDRTMRQRLAEVPLGLYRERYPAMRTLDAYYGPPEGPALTGTEFRGVPPGDNLVARNVCVGKWLRVGWHARPEALTLEGNLTDADPAFVGRPGDATGARAFALSPRSPAWALGFQRLPVEAIGLRPSPERRELRRLQERLAR